MISEQFPQISKQEKPVPVITELSPEVLLERSERLHRRRGVSFSAKTKEGIVTPLREQLKLAIEFGPGSAQFDFRNRTLEEIAEVAEDLAVYRRMHQDQVLSFHGDTPRIDEKDLAIGNKEKIVFESKLSAALSAESYTVHPPSVRSQQWFLAPEEARAAIIKSFLSEFDDATRAAIEDGNSLLIAIENMPNKGAEGSFGQSAGELRALIDEGERRLRENGVQTRGRTFGVTLDINHALEGTQPEDAERVISSWFTGLSDAIRVVHIYASSGGTEKLRANYELVLRLAAQYSPDALLLVESKQNAEATRRAFDSLRSASVE